MNNEPNLDRFRQAQERDYATALDEIRHGRKRSHWMWYIFPQLAGLGSSEVSRYYAIKDIREATAFPEDNELGLRITAIGKELLRLDTQNPAAVFGTPDDLKLKSSMTLFDAVSATFPVFGQVLDKFFGGERDKKTLDLLSVGRQNSDQFQKPIN
jgi:uncharacterized protein (DUF1810 family)